MEDDAMPPAPHVLGAADGAKHVGMSAAESILAELEVFGIKLGLGSTRALLGALGSPESAFPVVLVAGTNGKGSTANALSEILVAAGHRVGLYTSPHLEEIEERVRIDGACISADALASYLERVVELGVRKLGHPPTYFEALTVAAYLYFAEEGVDLAVMEVGLGGRLDATNAADPVLSIVTSIALDHTQVLGDSLERIAREKAGIFRAGRRALCWVSASEALLALEQEAQRRGAVLIDVSRQVSWSGPKTGLPLRRSLSLQTPVSGYRIDTALVGDYQTSNLALAVRAAESLAEAGLEVGRGAVEEGIRRCSWPGRCEVVHLPGGTQVLLEAAHNQEGMRWLSRQLEDRDGVEEKWRVIFGVLDDKHTDEEQYDRDDWCLKPSGCPEQQWENDVWMVEKKSHRPGICTKNKLDRQKQQAEKQDSL